MRRRRYQFRGELVLEAGSKWRAVLIREGVSKNGNRWTRPVLEQIAKLADGIKIRAYDFSPDGSKRFLHHWEALRRSLPRAIAALLPDRLEGAELATVRNPRVEMDGGVAAVVCDAEPIAARLPLLEQIVNVARRMGKTVGISIHVPEDQITVRSTGDGTREPTEVRGLAGFDLVSQPSAGGRLVPVLEALARRTAMKGFVRRLLRHVPGNKRAALEALLPKGWEQLETAEALLEAADEEATEALLEALGQRELEEAAVGAVLEALAKTPDAAIPPAKDKGKAKPKDKGKPPKRRAATLEGEPPDSDPDDDDQDDQVVDTTARDQIAEMRLDAGNTVIEACVDAAKLTPSLAKFATEQLGAMLEAAGSITKKACTDWIASLKAGIGASQASGGGLLESEDRVSRFSDQWTSGEHAEAALEALLDSKPFGLLADGKTKVPAFHGIKQAYQVIQGDVFLEGLPFISRTRRPSSVLESVNWEANPYMQLQLRIAGAGLEATIATSGFVNLLANIQNKRLARAYAELPHLWRLIAKPVPVADFKTRSIVRLGELGNLPVVAENGAYVDLALMTEEEVTSQIAKRGGLVPITWEAMLNDDIKGFRENPSKAARAADRTLNTAVWGKLLNNTNWDGDGVAVFHASAWPTGHANLTAAAYSFAQLKVMRRKAALQKDKDGREAGRIKLENIFVGPQVFDAIYEDMFSDGKPNVELGTAGSGNTENFGKANVVRSAYGWQLWEVEEFNEVSGSELDVIGAANVNVTEVMEVGFLNGNETPELFVQDMERVGTFFTNDRVTLKVRHVHDDGVVVDPRALQLLQAP